MSKSNCQGLLRGFTSLRLQLTFSKLARLTEILQVFASQPEETIPGDVEFHFRSRAQALLKFQPEPEKNILHRWQKSECGLYLQLVG